MVASLMPRLLIALALLSAPALAGEPGLLPPALRCPLDAPYDMSNPFARILRGERPASVVLETDTVIAFIPLDWAHPGHTLVVPKRAVRSLDDMTAAEIADVAAAVKRVAAAQRRALGASGYTLEQNNGRNQSVCHAHFHVVPNTPTVTPAPRTRGEMDAIAARLKAALPPA